jgi:hypothetical protein
MIILNFGKVCKICSIRWKTIATHCHNTSWKIINNESIALCFHKTISDIQFSDEELFFSHCFFHFSYEHLVSICNFWSLCDSRGFKVFLEIITWMKNTQSASTWRKALGIASSVDKMSWSYNATASRS